MDDPLPALPQHPAGEESQALPAAVQAPEPPPAAARERAGRARWLSPTDRGAIAIVLLTEVLTLLFGAFAFEVTADERVGTLRDAFAIWNRWDGPHYVDIAVHGYQNSGDPRFFVVFYPLFPWLVRLVTFFLRDPLLSAFAVSGLASLVTAVALARLTALDFSERVAYRTVWFLFIFPTAYFLHIGYTESLFIALVIAAFLAARRNQWLRAAILGALACLARMNGLLLVAALGVEALQRLWAERRWRWQYLWLALIPSGFGVYLLLNYRVAGDPFAFSRYEMSHWGLRLTWPWLGINESYKSFFWRSPSDAQMIGMQVLLYLAITLVATVVSIFTLRPSYAIWMVTNWSLLAFLSFDISGPRYDLALFPMFLVFARVARNRHWNAAITFWSLLSMGVFITHFVRGWWAF